MHTHAQAMSAGVPVILSNNTGHRDLMGDGSHIFGALQCEPFTSRAGDEGWGQA
jgi:hypothetical protein